MGLQELRGLRTGLILLGWLSTVMAGEDRASGGKADQRFEALLSEAKKDPKHANWKELRHAFAQTSHYNPHNTEWGDELAEVRRRFHGGEMEAAEEQITKLLERERFMRLDALLLAGAIYDRTGQEEKEQLNRRFIEGIAGTLFVPGTGMSYEKSIEVLFTDEEYFFLGVIEAKRGSQGLHEHEGHRFDVLETKAKGDEPSRTFYFNIDLPWAAPDRTIGRELREHETKP
jgi:hypothetical protein